MSAICLFDIKTMNKAFNVSEKNVIAKSLKVFFRASVKRIQANGDLKEESTPNEGKMVNGNGE